MRSETLVVSRVKSLIIVTGQRGVLIELYVVSSDMVIVLHE